MFKEGTYLYLFERHLVKVIKEFPTREDFIFYNVLLVDDIYNSYTSRFIGQYTSDGSYVSLVKHESDFILAPEYIQSPLWKVLNED